MYHKQKKKLFLTLSLLLLFILIISNLLLAEEKIFKEEEIFAEIIEFVISRDSVIDSQQNVMRAAFRLNEMKLVEDNLPTYMQSNLRQIEFDSLVRIQESQKTYAEIKRKLVTEISNNIIKLFSLKNEIIYQTELKELLAERLVGLERQVEAGIIDPESLIQLSEQLINIKTNIANNKNYLRFLKLELAFNYGGEDWQELLKLIEEIEKVN